MRGLKVGDIADRTFIALDENVLVAEGAKALYEHESCTIIVTSRGGQDKSADRSTKIPVGIVTERDFIHRIIAQNKGPFKVTLKDIMSSPIVTIKSEEPVKRALSILKKKRINRLPVMNRKGELEGIVTTEMIAKRFPEDALE